MFLSNHPVKHSLWSLKRDTPWLTDRKFCGNGQKNVIIVTPDSGSNGGNPCIVSFFIPAVVLMRFLSVQEEEEKPSTYCIIPTGRRWANHGSIRLLL